MTSVLSSSGKGTPDIQHMKRTILNEIKQVTESDLKIMTVQEITNFYNELVSGCTEQATVMNTQAQNPEPQQNKLKNDSGLEKINQSLVISKNQVNELKPQPQKIQKFEYTPSSQTIIDFNNQKYYRPRHLDHSSYKINNSRFFIFCGPITKSLQQKKQLLVPAYPQSMQATIRAFKREQVLQTFQRLIVPDQPQNFILRKYQNIQTKPFIIFVNALQIGDKQFIDGRKRVKKYKKKNIHVEENKEAQVQNNFDQFFDEYFDNEPLSKNAISQNQRIQKQKQKQKQKQRQKQKQKQKKVPSSNQMSFRQTLQSIKRKTNTENSVQTDIIINSQKKTKTKLTILNQVQFIQDVSEGSSEQLIRERPVYKNNEIIDLEQQIGRIPHKISIEDIKKAIQQPETAPKPQVIQWVKSMKHLLSMFQDQYMNQFKGNWVQINN